MNIPAPLTDTALADRAAGHQWAGNRCRRCHFDCDAPLPNPGDQFYSCPVEVTSRFIAELGHHYDPHQIDPVFVDRGHTAIRIEVTKCQGWDCALLISYRGRALVHHNALESTRVALHVGEREIAVRSGRTATEVWEAVQALHDQESQAMRT